MVRKQYEEVLEVLSCEFEARPRGAPGPADIMIHVKSSQRQPGLLTLEFEEAARDAVETFAAAERLCCAGIGWDVRSDPLRLVISAGDRQLDALTAMFSGLYIEKNQ